MDSCVFMKIRKDMDAETRSKAKIRYLPMWPFIELKVGTDDPIRSKATLSSITTKVLGFDTKPDHKLIDDLTKFEHRPKTNKKGKG